MGEFTDEFAHRWLTSLDDAVSAVPVNRVHLVGSPPPVFAKEFDVVNLSNGVPREVYLVAGDGPLSVDDVGRLRRKGCASLVVFLNRYVCKCEVGQVICSDVAFFGDCEVLPFLAPGILVSFTCACVTLNGMVLQSCVICRMTSLSAPKGFKLFLIAAVLLCSRALLSQCTDTVVLDGGRL